MTSKKVGADLQVGPKGATRRSFIAVASAALSAPVAAAAGSGSWLPPSGGSETLEARLARLEDVNEIRALNQALARHITAGEYKELAALVADSVAIMKEPGVCGIEIDDYGERDVIEIAPDRQTGKARLHVTLHTETEIGPDCTLVEMARQQGSGVISGSESAVMETTYARRDGVWKISGITHRPATSDT